MTAGEGNASSHAPEGRRRRPADPAICADRPAGFRRVARFAGDCLGSPIAFGVALLSIIVWAALGPAFHYSDTWQLVVNTATTVVTFLMVFLVQHTQNRDAKAIHLKLDELIRGVRGARTELVALEEMSDSELDRLEEQFKELRRRKRPG
jgi:low affinity Fe/Cu permease